MVVISKMRQSPQAASETICRASTDPNGYGREPQHEVGDTKGHSDPEFLSELVLNLLSSVG